MNWLIYILNSMISITPVNRLRRFRHWFWCFSLQCSVWVCAVCSTRRNRRRPASFCGWSRKLNSKRLPHPVSISISSTGRLHHWHQSQNSALSSSKVISITHWNPSRNCCCHQLLTHQLNSFVKLDLKKTGAILQVEWGN